MASIAEILIGQAGEAGRLKQEGDLGQSLARGFQIGSELALKQEQLAAQKAKVMQEKEQLAGAKMEKFVDALQKGANYQGSARTNYYQKWLPKYRDSLGLTQDFPDDSLKFATSTPENLSRIQTLVAKVQSGEMSRQDAILTLNNPTQFADVPPDVVESAYKELDDAAKTAIGAQAQRDALMASNNRFQQSEARQGEQFDANKKEALGKEVLKLDIPNMQTSVNRVEKVIPGGLDKWKGQPIPGVGGYEAKLPIGQLTPEGKRVRQEIQRIGNSYVKLMTGSGGSTQEMNRILGSAGLDQAIGEGGGITTLFTGTRSDRDVVEGLRAMKQALESQKTILKNTYGDQIYNTVVPSGTGKAVATETKAAVSEEKKAVDSVLAGAQALYEKYKGDPAKKKRILEEAKAKGLKIKE